MGETERLRSLRAARERLTVEMKAVEDGTLPWLEDRKDATPSDLADAFGLTPQAAGNRLVRLVEAGLADREPVLLAAGGRRYRYYVTSSDA